MRVGSRIAMLEKLLLAFDYDWPQPIFWEPAYQMPPLVPKWRKRQLLRLLLDQGLSTAIKRHNQTTSLQPVASLDVNGEGKRGKGEELTLTFNLPPFPLIGSEPVTNLAPKAGTLTYSSV